MLKYNLLQKTTANFRVTRYKGEVLTFSNSEYLKLWYFCEAHCIIIEIAGAKCWRNKASKEFFSDLLEGSFLQDYCKTDVLIFKKFIKGIFEKLSKECGTEVNC